MGGSPTRRCRSDEPRCTITRSISSILARSGLAPGAPGSTCDSWTRTAGDDALAAGAAPAAATDAGVLAAGAAALWARTTARSPPARAVTSTSNAPSSETYANVVAAPDSSTARAFPGASSSKRPSSCGSLKAVLVIARGVPCMSSCAGTSARSIRALARCETRAAMKRSSCAMISPVGGRARSSFD